MAEQNFAGKAVLVTGASSGIGRVAAMAFAAAGGKVVCADIAEAGGRDTAAAIQAAGGTACFIKADVAKAAEVEALVAGAVEAYGRLDVAFNNAGIEEESKPTHECDEAVFDRIQAINVKGVWLCLKAEIRQMLKQGGGSIVNTASVAGLIGAPLMPAYAASKHAVIGLTKTAAVEYAKFGIRVNAVCPGVIKTPMLERALAADPRRADRIVKLHPVGRLGTPEEVTAGVLWLASDAASFVTGHALAVEGGLLTV